jgi:hypothetical protein
MERMKKPYKTYCLGKLKNLENEVAGTDKLNTVDLMPTLTGSSLICDNKVLVSKRTIFKAKNKDPTKLVQKFCWTFWDVEKQVEVRQALPPRIDGVFFQKFSEETILKIIKSGEPSNCDCPAALAT